MNVFVIINEWVNNEHGGGAEIVESKFYLTENDAWEALLLIAQSYDTTLYADETSLAFEDHKPHIQYEEYYIQELVQA